MTMYVDREGDSISMERWSELFGNLGYKTVGSTYSDDGTVHVSTVWIGMYPGSIFETMVFIKGEEDKGEHYDRYLTNDQAVDGHARFVSEYITRPQLKAAFSASGSHGAVLDGAL